MRMRAPSIWAVAIAFVGAACTVNQTAVPELTGPSTFATSLTISANPDTTAMGQSATALGQQSLIIATVFDANGQPKPNQTVRFDTLVNGQLSDCGQLSRTTLVTGIDGRASTVFTAPGTPPDCPSFNADGSVTIRATPVGTDFAATAFTASSVKVFMAVPVTSNVSGSLTASFSILPPATGSLDWTFTDASTSPGHNITSRTWTFSTGETKSGQLVQYDFAGAAGTFTVTLTVTDDAQQTSFKTALVTVAR